MAEPGTPEDEGLTLERNFPSYFRGERELFQERLPLEDLVSLAEIGVPLTVSGEDGYSMEELLTITRAVVEGGGALTVRHPEVYDRSDLDALLRQANGRVILA